MEICVAFEVNAEMTEWFSEEITGLLRQDHDKFAEGLASLDESKFNCLSYRIDLAWGADDQGEGYDPNLASQKLATSLKKGKFSDSPNVKKLVEKLE